MKTPLILTFSCTKCPAYGSETCMVLSDLGMYCDVKVAASQWAALSRLVHQRAGVGRAPRRAAAFGSRQRIAA